MESNMRSIRGNVGAFVISNGSLTACFPMPQKDDACASRSLTNFIDDIGVPHKLRTDGADSFIGRHTHFQTIITRNDIDLTFQEAGRHNQIYRVDVEIRELRKMWHRLMSKYNVTARLWCFGLEYAAKL